MKTLASIAMGLVAAAIVAAVFISIGMAIEKNRADQEFDRWQKRFPKDHWYIDNVFVPHPKYYVSFDEETQ